MVKITDNILRFTDASSTVVLVGLDIWTTFDMVNHNILLRRLKQDFGISGLSLQWLASYLSGRSFCVHLRRSSLSYVMTSTGVPQESVLGPLLFTSDVAPADSLI